MGINIEVPVAELQKHKIFVATPMYGGQCFGSYTKSILDLSRVCTQYGIECQFSFLFNESLITRARNYLVDEFLRSESMTHLMFIDSDIDFNPMDVIALLAMKKPIIGGPYPKKCIAWENVYDAARYGLVPSEDRGKLADFAGDFVFNPAPGATEIKLDAPAEVLEIGTGFMLVERSVFQTFSQTYPNYWYTPDHNRSAAFDGSRKIYQYFQAEIEPERNRYLSEDYWFCQKARQAGISVWLAPWMNIKHHGSMIYGGSIPAMATVQNERTKRNDVIPHSVRMDKSVPSAPTKSSDVTILTVTKFNQYSSAKRKEQFEQWSKSFDVPEKVLAAKYKESRDELEKTIPDSPVIEQITKLVEAIKAAKE
jgi:hypothetical protein